MPSACRIPWFAAVAALACVACKGSERAPVPSEKPRLVYKDDTGRELTTRDLEGTSGTVNWEIVGADDVPAEAMRLHDEARAAGGRGEYDRALELLDRARKLAPRWPYPAYDAAYTYELMGDPVRAEALYLEVDQLAPRGFFTCKTSLDCLRRERAGAVPKGFCKTYAMIEFLEPAAKKSALEGVVAELPSYAPAWQQLSTLLDEEGGDDAMLHAIEQGLKGNPDGETRGMLLINKALILDRRGDRDGAIQILGALALEPSSTLATETLAKATLAQVAGVSPD
jgi:tetratricopeptide (TPR) repeat protein